MRTGIQDSMRQFTTMDLKDIVVGERMQGLFLLRIWDKAKV